MDYTVLFEYKSTFNHFNFLVFQIYFDARTYIRMEKNIRLLYFLSGMIGLSMFSGKAIVKTNLQSPLLIIYFPSVSLVRATSLLFSHIEKLNYFSSPLLTTKLKSKSRKFTNSKRNCNVLFESQIKCLMLYLYLSNIIVISSIVFYFKIMATSITQ